MVLNSKGFLIVLAGLIAVASPAGSARAESGGSTPTASAEKARPPMVLSPQGLAKFYGTWTVPSGSPSAAPLVQSGALPAAEPSASPSLEPSGPPAPLPLGKTNVPQLRNSFEKALSEERLSLAHRQKLEMQQLKASQKQTMREWMAHEKTARKEFFDKTESGNAKAQWMKDRKARYSKLRREQEAELGSVRKAHDQRRENLRKEQEDRRRRFEEAVKQGLLPGEELWPAKGK